MNTHNLSGIGRYHLAGPERKAEFHAAGHRIRDWFPHRVHRLRKGGPDAMTLSRAMCGMSDPERLREIVLYATPPATDEFPPELFFDDDLIWHAQHFGLPGHIATANLVLDGDRMYGMSYVSDLYQRISRRRDWKTRVETIFYGWPALLLNAIGDYALERGVRYLYSASSELTLRYTDKKRNVQPPLFERVYDRAVQRCFDAVREGDWWRIDIPANRERLVRLDRVDQEAEPLRAAAIVHDVERGLGHTYSDPAYAVAVEGPAREALTRMLAVEARSGVRMTYDVVGSILDEVRPEIEAGGNVIAFHSFDHDVRGGFHGRLRRLREHALTMLRPEATASYRQLLRCRYVDLRIKGYRPPQSRIDPGLNQEHLGRFNFEWLASARRSIGGDRPWLAGGIVKIPILTDDYPLYRGAETYEDWERRVLTAMEGEEFVAVGLHDCYGQFWLPGYERFLDRVKHIAPLVTMDEVASRVALAEAE